MLRQRRQGRRRRPHPRGPVRLLLPPQPLCGQVLARLPARSRAGLDPGLQGGRPRDRRRRRLPGAARRFRADQYGSDGGPHGLWHDQGRFFVYTGRAYESRDEGRVKGRLWTWLGNDWRWVREGRGPKKDWSLVPYHPTRSSVAHAVEALAAVSQLPRGAESPCWLDGRTGPDPRLLIPFRNGVLDAAAYLGSGEARLLPHTPALFSLTCLPTDFEPEAACPLWHAFLRDATQDDAQTMDLLGEWAGYNLIPDNRHQSLLFAIGPPRSGKGTYLSVLEEVVGVQNVASFTLRDLAGEFGLQTLPGKLAAVCPDAHVPRDRDVVNALEIIKTVTGDGRVRVNPKGERPFDARLFCRFSVAMNQLPRLTDASGAMRKRVLVARFPRGREQHEIDPMLLDRLQAELRGVAVWAPGAAATDGAGPFRAAGGEPVRPRHVHPLVLPDPGVRRGLLRRRPRRADLDLPRASGLAAQVR